ncbi:hypothetical protein SARC_09142 [Sphaeroforma arctica JP610]|uniref:Uncharacterized protein n=1 Tax=Sphaeroforma arctica JP610 TaxID=667725 RepID=A0A0L0FQZ3_9EUKA|nr:hypothetical protein SARC_09142 [Sphaeroforma arctica JP610]KNC78428.1 hypothetical protein SARC_09142 [Sphaeroforma arctica JP610]|eukprot:XP_014152330.1 hypothetical protein SARC_09142 [Sphaeroforma arctica JP610]
MVSGVSDVQSMSSTSEANEHAQDSKCPCYSSTDLTRSESRIRFSLKKFSHSSVASFDEFSLNATTPRSRRVKTRKGGVLPSELKLFLTGSRKSSDASDSSANNASPDIIGNNYGGNIFRYRSSQSSTDTAIGDCGVSSLSASRTPSRKLSADMDQLMTMYKKEVSLAEESVLCRVNDLDVKVQRTIVNLAALSSKDCSHDTCIMVQVNVAKKLLDKTFKAAIKCRSAVSKYLLKQNDKIWRMAHLDGAEVELSDCEMKFLFGIIHAAFRRSVALANEVLQSVHSSLIEWDTKLCRISKLLLKPSRGIRGPLRRDNRTSPRNRAVLTSHDPEPEMQEPYIMKYATGKPYALIELQSPSCVAGLGERSC